MELKFFPDKETEYFYEKIFQNIKSKLKIKVFYSESEDSFLLNLFILQYKFVCNQRQCSEKEVSGLKIKYLSYRDCHNLTRDILFNQHTKYFNILSYYHHFATFLNIDRNFFFPNEISNRSGADMMSFGSNNSLEKLFINNFFFNNYLKVNTPEELYTTLLTNFNLKFKEYNQSPNVYYTDTNQELYIDSQNNGVGIFSKNLDIAERKKGRVMLFYFKKGKHKNINLFNVTKFIPHINNKLLVNNIDLSQRILKNKIEIKYSEEFNAFLFGVFKFKAGTLVNTNILIQFLYYPEKNAIYIVNQNLKTKKYKVENLFYSLEGNIIYRCISGMNNNKVSKYKYKIAEIDNKKIDIVNNVLPYEYIIIIVFCFFLKKKEKENKNFSQHGGSFWDRLITTNKKNRSLIKRLDDLKNIKFNINNNNNSNNILGINISDSWIFQYYYYRAKYNIMKFYQKIYIMYSQEINELIHNYDNIVERLQN